MTDEIKITVGGTPAGEGRVGCRCDDLAHNDFKRCRKHSRMMKAIADLYWKTEWSRADAALITQISEHADGYGEPGFTPDWSAYRDSSAYAIEQMYAELRRGAS